MTELEFHPYANLFPLIEGDAFADLVADVRKHGLREPIILLDGKILDGRNRYRAAVAAGIWRRTDREGVYRSWDWLRTFDPTKEGEPLAFVISANLHRRHLDETQRAMVATKLATMGHGGRRQAKGKPPIGDLGMTQADAAKALNVSERQVQRARVVAEQGAPELVALAEKGAIAVSAAESLAHLPKDEQTRLIKTADPATLYSVIKAQKDALTQQKKVRRVEREATLGAKQRALPNKRYGVIYADPEWEHQPWSEQGLAKAAVNHYPVSSLAAIKARPVQDIAARDCVLFMWTTVPHLSAAMSVVEAWGFTYKSSLVWHKTYPGARQGMGYWFRINHEVLIVATRGDVPAPAPGTQWPSVVEHPVLGHSEKPDTFAELIEAYFPTLPKIELNARRARDGWDVWGYEAPAPAPDDEPPLPLDDAVEIPAFLRREAVS